MMPQVGYVEYGPADLKLPIKFTGKSGLFRCTYAGVPYEDTEIQALREKVLTAIKSTYNTLDWTAIIEISLEMPTKNWQIGAHFSITRERKYIAHHPDFGYKQSHWTVPAQGRLLGSRPFPWEGIDEFTPPTARESYGKQTTYLPYSEELWQSLEEIEKYLLIAARKLRQGGFSSPERVSATLATCRMLFDHFANQDEETEDR
jgi:hypothetical protein